MAEPRPLPGRPLSTPWEDARLPWLPGAGKVRPVGAGKRGRGELARFLPSSPWTSPDFSCPLLPAGKRGLSDSVIL